MDALLDHCPLELGEDARHPGHDHVFQNVVPMMRHRDFAASGIDAMLVANPRRPLALRRKDVR